MITRIRREDTVRDLCVKIDFMKKKINQRINIIRIFKKQNLKTNAKWIGAAYQGKFSFAFM